MSERLPKPSIDHGAGRVTTLDGLRGVAVLLVFQQHISTFGLLGFRDKTAADLFVLKSMNAGWCGVDLFFVLSGFLITGILLQARQHGNYLRNFYARRALRIFPLYYGFLVVVIFVLPHIVELRGQLSELQYVDDQQFWLWTYTTNIAIAFPEIMRTQTPVFPQSHLWSLAVEEQFYLAWPCLVLLTTRRQLMAACVGAIALSVVLRFYYTSQAGVSAYRSYMFTLTRLDPLAVGALIACIAVDPASLARVRRPAVTIGALALGVLVALGLHQQAFLLTDANTIRYGYLALAVLGGAALILAATVTGGRVGGLLSHPVLTTIGKYGYAIYVVQIVVIDLIGNHFALVFRMPRAFGSVLPAVLIFDLVCFAATFAIAALSWHLYESQFLKLKRFFPQSKAI